MRRTRPVSKMTNQSAMLGLNTLKSVDTKPRVSCELKVAREEMYTVATGYLIPAA
jgi:hypothetical protein